MICGGCQARSPGAHRLVLDLKSACACAAGARVCEFGEGPRGPRWLGLPITPNYQLRALGLTLAVA